MRMSGYINVTESCQGTTPNEALEKLAKSVLETAVKYQMMACGGVWMQPYVDTDGVMYWAVAQTLVAYSEEHLNKMHYFSGEEMR